MTVVSPSNAASTRASAGHAAANRKWAALHDSAHILATLAGVGPGPETAVLDFRAVMRGAAPWQHELAERGIDDVAAALRPGLRALKGIESRGVDPAAAARGLWRQFTEARAAILALSSPAAA